MPDDVTPDRPSDEPPAEATAGPSSEHTSLRGLLLGRPKRIQLVVAVLLAALGFAAVVQVRLTRTGDDFSGARRDDLVVLLDSLSGASDRAQKQISDLEQTRTELQTSSLRRQAAVEEIRHRIAVLEILTGTVSTVGPGITVTIDDPDSAMTPAAMLDGIDELRDAGAEAIEINDTVRVVASTAIADDGGVLTADGVALRAPYVIDAIGSAHTLSEAVVFPGGLQDDVQDLGGTVATHESDSIQVGSLHTMTAPEYAQPTP